MSETDENTEDVKVNAKDVMYKVFDLNANVEDDHGKFKPRVHEIITDMDADGNVKRTKRYPLYADKGTEMPVEHAMKFLKDAAFRVEDDQGNIIKPVRKERADRTELDTDEVVATFDELTKEALFKRCQVMPGSEGIKKSTKKDDLIDFLVEAAERKKAAGISRGSEGKIGEMEAGDMDNLLDLSSHIPAKPDGDNILSQVTT